MTTHQRKTAIVTGASQGIGAGLVEAFLKLGYNVVGNSRNITKTNPFPGSVSKAWPMVIWSLRNASATGSKRHSRLLSAACGQARATAKSSFQCGSWPRGLNRTSCCNWRPRPLTSRMRRSFPKQVRVPTVRRESDSTNCFFPTCVKIHARHPIVSEPRLTLL